MGATNFVDEVEATTPREGFKKLCEEAVEYSGYRDGYNGTISTCNIGSCALRFDRYTKTNETKAYKFIEEKDGGVKWTANYIDLGVVRYEVIVAKKAVKECKSKYKMKYVVSPKFSQNYNERASFDGVQEANKKAMELALKYGKPMQISKEYVNIGGESIIGEVSLELKQYKTKPTLKDMPNRKMREIHKYIFFGYASC